MANLTIAIDAETLRRARRRAAEQGTSVNAILREFLDRFAGVDPTAKALADFLALAEAAGGSSGPGGRTWRREDLYDRPDVR